MRTRKGWGIFWMMMCLWISGLQVVAAQEVFVPKTSRYITRFGFEMLSGGVVIIRAAIDNHGDSLNFILDTGSGGISLDSSTADRLALKRSASDKTIRGIAGIKQVDFTYNHTLRMPGIAVDSLDFHINDYSLLSGIYGMRIDGIAGYSLLNRYVVKLDYEKLTIDFWTPGEVKYPRGGQVIMPAFSGLPMQYLELEDAHLRTGRFYLDTGAGLCLLLSEDYAMDSSIFSSRRRMFSTIAEGLGGKKEMKLSVIKSLKLGNFRFKQVPTYIFDDEYNVTQYPFLGGLLGNDLLRRFNVVFNYPERQIHLLPNHHYREAFDYAYTGMGMFYEDDIIYIVDVVPGSPADKAGLKNEDIVVSIANDLTGDLQHYKTLLQSAGSGIKIIVNRNGELFETIMKVANIKKKKRRF